MRDMGWECGNWQHGDNDNTALWGAQCRQRVTRHPGYSEVSNAHWQWGDSVCFPDQPHNLPIVQCTLAMGIECLFDVPLCIAMGIECLLFQINPQNLPKVQCILAMGIYCLFAKYLLCVVNYWALIDVESGDVYCIILRTDNCYRLAVAGHLSSDCTLLSAIVSSLPPFSFYFLYPSWRTAAAFI